MTDPRQVAVRWAAQDPDPATRAATEVMLAAADERALADCFGSRLSFGTAGLRGALGPGPNRMNRALVIRVTAGLADWVLAEAQGRGPVVVGFDGRTGSRVFAEDTARVLAGRGLSVRLFDTVCATPLLAWAVRRLAARAGVMVTASHNPKEDNGYKVFWSDGAQIIGPHDTGISQSIDAIGDLDTIERPSMAQARSSGAVQDVPSWVRESYVEAALAVRVHAPTRPLKVVYSAMHGVGWSLVAQVLGSVDTISLHPVPEQRDPDPMFPSVAFPNPEEPGALDLAYLLATDIDADLVIANDPDADRLAVAVPVPGGWRPLTGNEIGALLGEDLLAHGQPGPRTVATTLVSSALLSRIAAHHGARYAETLTGFKWIARAADGTSEPLVFGYEEALGYSVGGLVRDKDGVSAALVFCDLVAHAAELGRTVPDLLDALALRHGVHHTDQRSVVLPGNAGRARIDAAMQALRGAPPAVLGGLEVVRLRDLSTGSSDLPPSDVLGFELDGGHRVHVRPSGTEPKLKIYVEAVVPVQDSLGSALARARVLATTLLDSVVSATGLTPPG